MTRARGALRPLFLLRSCAADQEKRPEKKSWAVMACVSLRLERPGSTCIRSAPRCISRGQRKKFSFGCVGKRFGSWVCGACAARRGGALLASGPESRFLRVTPRGCWRLRGGAKFRWRVAAEGGGCALRRAGSCVGAGPAGRCGRFSCFAHAPLIKKSGQKRNHGLLWPALPSGQSA